MPRAEPRTGTLASQLGFGYSNNGRRRRSSQGTEAAANWGVPQHKTNKFMARVLENSVRAGMEERDARLLAERDRLERTHRISTLYGANRTSELVRGRAKRPRRKDKLTTTRRWPNEAKMDTDEGNIVAEAKTRGQAWQQARRAKKQSKAAWRLGCWQHQDPDVQLGGPCTSSTTRPTSAQHARRRGAVLIMTEGGPMPHYMVPKRSSVNLSRPDKSAAPLRPQSAGPGRLIVSGEVKKWPKTRMVELEHYSALVQSAPTSKEALDLLEAPLRERERRRAMRKQVALALEGLPRLRVVSTTQLRKHLDPEVTAEGHIDRASFVSALRSSGLTNQTNLLSRIFSSFDMDDRNAISVCDFLDFYTALRKRVQATTAIAPSVLFMAD